MICGCLNLQTEIDYLGQLHHPNLVRLIGFCLEDEHRLLVYEFMPRGSLENHLFRSKLFTYSTCIPTCLLRFSFYLSGVSGSAHFQPLSWSLRLKVALGAAKGLAFLHSEEAKVIYRDFKSSNILLDSVSETIRPFRNYVSEIFVFESHLC